MDARALTDRLLAAGLDPVERTPKIELFERVLGRWRSTAKGSPQAAWFVPGRLELFGTHTDYAGGRTLVAAVPRGFAFAMAPRRDSHIHIVDASSGDEGAIDTTVAATPRFKGWRHYVEVCAARLARNFAGASLGAEIVFASDLPRAAGMSSSSALVVGVATSLIEAGQLR